MNNKELAENGTFAVVGLIENSQGNCIFGLNL